VANRTCQAAQEWPLLERFLPGSPTVREALIVHTAYDTGEDRLAVIAGLPAAKSWTRHNQAIDAIEQRREMREQRAQAGSGLGQSKADEG
jgi:hypothetical protein